MIERAPHAPDPLLYTNVNNKHAPNLIPNLASSVEEAPARRRVMKASRSDASSCDNWRCRGGILAARISHTK